MLKRYVVSEDIGILLAKWATEKNFTLPSDDFLANLRRAMLAKLKDIFYEKNCAINWEKENNLMRFVRDFKPRSKYNICLDKVYAVKFADFQLDISRLVDTDLNDTGLGSSALKGNIDEQLLKFNLWSKKDATNNLVLVDDVIFSGEGMVEIIKKIENLGGKVTDILASIIIRNGFDTILQAFPNIYFTSYVFYEDVVDEVCERDFYAGIPYSGRLIGKNGLSIAPETGAPYFAPFGNAEKWASIPKDRVADWSKFCLKQSIKLWEEIEKVSGKPVFSNDLTRRPRFIPNDNSRFVEQLKKFL